MSEELRNHVIEYLRADPDLGVDSSDVFFVRSQAFVAITRLLRQSKLSKNSSDEIISFIETSLDTKDIDDKRNAEADLENLKVRVVRLLSIANRNSNLPDGSNPVVAA